MSALAEILSTYQLFVGGEDLVETLTNESQGKQVSNATIGENLYLDLNGKKVERGRCWCYVDFRDSADIREVLLATDTMKPTTGSTTGKLDQKTTYTDVDDAAKTACLDELLLLLLKSAFLPLSSADRAFFT